jgi:uncharacterized protein with von Willebrand factor type A (vWA) domain
MTLAANDDAELGAHVATAFAAVLRRHGLAAPLSSVLTFAEALSTVGLAKESALYWTGRSIFVHGPDEVVPYNTAFFTYWRAPPDSLGRERPPILVIAPTPSDIAPPDDDSADFSDTEVKGASFSAAERLFRADLATLSDEELAEAIGMLAIVKRERDVRSTRRLGPGRDGRLDLRRSVASAVKRDGEVIGEHHLQRRQRERRIVVLCDVSGSMEPYARAMLRLAHVLSQGTAPIEVFAMGTRLTRLTRRLATRDANLALQSATAAIPDYSGGTRLGDALAEFNSSFGVRGAARGATVVICSDGIDRGSPELISSEMARLSRVAHRIIWVNPLAASPGYEPLARGMAAAMPYIDRFLAGDTTGALDVVLRAITAAARHRLPYALAA